MPPPSLLSSTIVRLTAQAPCGEQPADIVRQRDVADQQHDRAGARGGHAERGRDGAVDPVRAAVGEHSRRGLGGREEQLDVTDRHRGSDEQGRVGRQPFADPGGDKRLGQLLAERLVDRPAGDVVGGAPAGEPVGVLRPVRRARCEQVGRARSQRRERIAAVDRGQRAGGSWYAPSGSSASCSTSASDGEPVAQRLGGRQIADANHEVGPHRDGEAIVAQQQVVASRSPPVRGARPTAGRQAADSRRAARAAPPPGRGRGRVRGGRRRARREPRAGRASARDACGGRAGGVSSLGAAVRVTHGRPSGRPPVSCGSGSSSTSGSRSGRFRCTGPGRPSSAVQ